jgi:hypothetical protein
VLLDGRFGIESTRETGLTSDADGRKSDEMNLDELLRTLESPIVIRPTRRMTQGELESYLDKAADILRGNADHSEFRG